MQQASGPIQLALFPVDEEERVLLAQGRLYAALPEDARRMVRAYLAMIREGNGRRQADWIRASGMAQSTAHDIIKRYEVQLWPAIQEACQLLGGRGAAFGAMAIPVAGQIILRDLVQGKRSTASLTQVEFGILKECEVILGLRPVGISAGMSVTAPDGTTMTAVAGDGGLSPSELAEGLRLLRGRMRRTEGAGGEAERPDSVRPAAEGVPAVLEGTARAEGAGPAEAAEGAVGEAQRAAEAQSGAVQGLPAATVRGTVGEPAARLDDPAQTAGNGRDGSRLAAATAAVLVLLGVLAVALGGAARVGLQGGRGVAGAWGRAAEGTPVDIIQWAGVSGKISSRKSAGSVSSSLPAVGGAHSSLLSSRCCRRRAGSWSWAAAARAGGCALARQRGRDRAWRMSSKVARPRRGLDAAGPAPVTVRTGHA